jgi:signal transduction histidine kinase/CheY-like chemotaxis protein
MHSKDPTMAYMVLDIVHETLAASNSIDTLANKLTTQIREMTGAKVVVFIEYGASMDHFDLSLVSPQRYKEKFNPALLRMLLESWHALNKVTLIRFDDARDSVADFLRENRFEINLICPLVAKEKKVGILLALGLVDDNIIPSLHHIFAVLLDTVAIIIENSKLMRNQEETIEAKTIELKKALVSAEEATKAKSEFLANMSHEIRTPLNAVLGFAQILKSMELDPKKARFIDNIHTSGKALLDLINDILDISKIEAGKLNLHYSAVSIVSLFNEIQAVFEEKITNKGLQFVVETSGEFPEALILDEIRLRQILINLLGNAVKFTDMGHIRLSAGTRSLDSSTSQVDLIITVEDTGVGIPPDQKNKIFGTFEQASRQKNAKHGGTGLGLAITRRLVKLMGGEISVESEEGKGSSFSVILHNVELTAIETLSDKSSSSVDFDLISFERATILIADDIECNREMLATYLAPYDFDFIHAENGHQAIEKTTEHHPDLILLDMKMPGMDGYEASHILNNTPGLKDIPVIAVTASALKQDEEVISKLCNGYLRKPTSKADLIAELIRFLPHRIIENEVVSAELQEKISEPPTAVATTITPHYQALQNIHVLLVEDSEINQELTAEMLKEFEINVNLANNGQEAVELAEQHDFDLVLMDLQMPVMDGLTATRAIRKLDRPGIATLPILATSGGDWAADMNACLSAGMNGHLRKPYTLEELASTLMKHLAKRPGRP